jgi:hypothetical protein
MAIQTGCQTPGAQYSTYINPNRVLVHVEFGRLIELTETQAAELEANMHNAIELVLARYYQ